MKEITKEYYSEKYCNNYVEKYLNIPEFIPTSSPDEVLRLINKYSQGHKTILEIGTWIGRSALGFSQNFSRVVTLDFIQGSDIPYGYNGLEAGHYCKNLSNVEFLKINSKDFYTEEKFDCVYVDGNHSYEGFLSDMVLSKKICKAGGLIFIDDYYNPTMGVGRAANDHFRNELVSIKNTNLIFIENS